MDDFNAGNTTSFGFAGNDFSGIGDDTVERSKSLSEEKLLENKSLSLNDTIKNDSLEANVKDFGDIDFSNNIVDNSVTNTVTANSIVSDSNAASVNTAESEFASAVEMTKQDGDTYAGMNLNSFHLNSLQGSVIDLTSVGDKTPGVPAPLMSGVGNSLNSELERELEIGRSIDELMGLNKPSKSGVNLNGSDSNEKMNLRQQFTLDERYVETVENKNDMDYNESHVLNEPMLNAATCIVNTGLEEDSNQGFDVLQTDYRDEVSELPEVSGFDLVDNHAEKINHVEEVNYSEEANNAEEVSYVEAGSEKVDFHTQIAEPIGDGLRVDENMKTASTFKSDPFIGNKLDLIIGAYEKNKLLTIEEIYRNSRMETDTRKTIFMTDIFLQAIPSSLPTDVKRETVLNILKISGIELEMLLSDAYKRIDSLNKVHEDTIATSNDIYQRNENTIRELERRIQDLKEINSARQAFQEDQNTMIEYEVQKIINLVDFVKPKTR